ncbi:MULTISPECIES: SRPBCC domain-containing protein [Haloferax]|uniref:SRPBCC domain-containing protein n=2 Tax=Haloferax TaxID=2251 RepID=A0A6G1Z0N2_9EURY|nr:MULTISPECIES: SRPBCC domain-containing protein [Haloferax]KAB1187448.1 SRPBCC domain-containing protein [Haloferax sp. CBA1149]MRW80100.1 SRPBCC domain-containing protein [Haloferax marinisediminis]
MSGESRRGMISTSVRGTRRPVSVVLRSLFFARVARTEGMQEIRTEIEIDAPPATVWTELTDLSSYSEWNPHIPDASGTLEVGESLDILVRRAGVKDRSMTVTVTALDPGKRFEWVGKLLSPRVFEGRHTMVLEPVGEEKTRLINRERITGVFARFVTTAEPERDYEAMNRALKERVEQTARASVS